MPLTPKDIAVLRKFRKRYGRKRGKDIFYASIQKGTLRGIPESRRLRRKMRRSRRRLR
jgi:hypothetical protein